MKKPILFIFLFTIGVTLATAGPKAPKTEDRAEMMEKHMMLAKPGPEHDKLANMSGTWDVTARYFMPGQNEPVTGTGTSTCAMILDGRFLQCEAEISMMGMPAKSMSILGFDRRHEEYFAIGFDTQGTYYVEASGPADESGDRLVLSGTDDDPIGGFTQVYDFVYTFDGDDKFTVELFFKNPEMTGGKDEYKMMEMEFTRAK